MEFLPPVSSLEEDMASDACTDVISDPIEDLGSQSYPKAGSSKAEKRATVTAFTMCRDRMKILRGVW